MSEDNKAKLEALKESFERLEQQMAQGMSPQTLDAAIKEVAQSIQLLEQMQQQPEGESNTFQNVHRAEVNEDDENPER